MYLKKWINDAAGQITRHLDDNNSVFARHLLTATLQELFRFSFRKTKWASGELMSITTNMNDGAREVSWQMLGDVGTAGIVADNATDVPTADVQGTLNINKVHTIATSICYSTQDIRSARMQGLFDIATEKARAAREAHDRELDRLIRVGDASKGIEGVLDLSGSHHVTATTGNWGTTATPAQILADFLVAYQAIYDGSSGVEEPNTAVFASSVWPRISTLQNSVASDATVLDFLKKSYPRITLWTDDAALNTGGDDGGPCVMLYDRDRSRIRGMMPLTLRPLPQEQHGLVFKTVFESRYGGLAAPRPRALAKITGV